MVCCIVLGEVFIRRGGDDVNITLLAYTDRGLGDREDHVSLDKSMKSEVIEAAKGQTIAVIRGIGDFGNQARACEGGDAAGEGAVQGRDLGDEWYRNDLVVL